MTRTFYARRSYHPSYSLLGRAVHARVDDRLRGEALLLVVLTGLALLLVMSHYLGWALLKPILAGHPSWQALFWGGQVASVLVLAGVGLVGFRPAVRVTCTPHAVEFAQGDRTRTLPSASITEVETVSVQRYHRHYRRYAATQIFVSRVPDEMLLLRTEEGPVIVGLPDAEAQAALLDHLQTRHSPSSTPVAQSES